jgi:hypothetical protein
MERYVADLSCAVFAFGSCMGFIFTRRIVLAFTAVGERLRCLGYLCDIIFICAACVQVVSLFIPEFRQITDILFMFCVHVFQLCNAWYVARLMELGISGKVQLTTADQKLEQWEKFKFRCKFPCCYKGHTAAKCCDIMKYVFPIVGACLPIVILLTNIPTSTPSAYGIVMFVIIAIFNIFPPITMQKIISNAIAFKLKRETTKAWRVLLVCVMLGGSMVFSLCLLYREIYTLDIPSPVITLVHLSILLTSAQIYLTF